MSKIRQPLLSFSASGTIANSLTFTDSPVGPRAQQIPTHPNPRSLPQLYQRWKFRDAQFAWQNLTPAQRAAYDTARYPAHMTGQQRHTRYYLRNLPDLALWLPLDSRTGFAAPDLSKHANHGVITGATPSPAVIDYGRLFDGIDDQILCPHSPSLNLGLSDFSLLCWIRPTAAGALHTKWIAAPRRYYWLTLRSAPQNDIRLTLADGVTRRYSVPWLINPFDGAWHHCAVVIHFTNLLYFYLDAQLQGTVDVSATTGSIDNTNPFIFAFTGPRHTGPADDVRIYTRALSPAHIAYIHSQERYTSPP